MYTGEQRRAGLGDSGRIAVTWRSGGTETELQLAVLRAGAGPDVALFIHGLGCAKESFEGAFGRRALARACEAGELHLIAPDLPGFGASPRPRGFGYTAEDQAALLGELLKSVGAVRVHLVAHSMGGAIGLLLASALGERLASFLNVEGNLVAADCTLLSRRAAEMDQGDFARVAFPKLVTALARSREPAAAEVAGWLERADPVAFWQSARSLVALSDGGGLAALFRQLAGTKLYVHGERSPVAEALASLGPVRRVRVAQCGHFVMQEQPEVFYDLVERVLLEPP